MLQTGAGTSKLNDLVYVQIRREEADEICIQVPPYVFPLLVLSKRLHSIFVLRCFNDCFAVLGLFAALFCYQRDQWHLGSFFFATGLNVKMSLLLPLPAMGILMIQKLGSREAMTQAMIIFQVTVSFGIHFQFKVY